MATPKSTVVQVPSGLCIQTEDRACNPAVFSANSLIVNADDWGRDSQTTDRILECVSAGTVSSTSAMVFMADSERAASLARERGVDCGLHLNFTTPFSDQYCPSRLKDHQGKIAEYLRRSHLAQTVYHPGLVSSFKYVTQVQIEEFERIFGSKPGRLDGHHHMHLCANIVFGELLPAATMVRRNFSFGPREKSGINRLYRKAIDRVLVRRHLLTDYFFSLPPLQPQSRLDEIFSLAGRSVVEIETHPVNRDEYLFLTSGEILRRKGDLAIARGFANPVKPTFAKHMDKTDLQEEPCRE
jgi:predicted glycoside hydrolase/deacetylase ChbG (UPF0249 family)